MVDRTSGSKPPPPFGLPTAEVAGAAERQTLPVAEVHTGPAVAKPWQPSLKNPPLTNNAQALNDRLQALVDQRAKLGMPPDPKLSKLGVQWQPVVDGALYVDGISAADVVQGSAGTCFLLAPLAAIANVDPKLIRDAITQSDDGTFTVRFFERGKGGKSTPIFRTVTAELPLLDGQDRVYARAADSKELWPSIVEKAYADWKGGYQVIDGGQSQNFIRELTGREAHGELLLFLTPKQVEAKLSAAIKANRPMTATTWPAGSNGGLKVLEVGLREGHEFTIMAFEKSNGVPSVTLRDPNGTTASTLPGADQGKGTVTLPLSKFIEVFGYATL